jgi:hypothetical protein
VLALCTFVLTLAGESDAASRLTDAWMGLVRQRRGFYTSFAWPLAGRAIRILGREAELLSATDRLRIRTPWLESARSAAEGDDATAARIVQTLGADGIVELMQAAGSSDNS